MMSLWHNYVIVTSYGELPPLNLAPYKSVSANSYRHVYTLHGLLYGNAITWRRAACVVRMCYVPVSGLVSCLADDVRRFAFVFTIQPGQAIRNMSTCTCSPIGVAGILRHSYTLCTTQLRNARSLFGCRTFASLILTVLSTNAPAAAKGVKKRYASTVGADIQAPNYQGGYGEGVPPTPSD